MSSVMRQIFLLVLSSIAVSLHLIQSEFLGPIKKKGLVYQGANLLLSPHLHYYCTGVWQMYHTDFSSSKENIGRVLKWQMEIKETARFPL